MSCVIRGCKSHSSRKGNEVETVTFHRFPRYAKTRQMWIDTIAQQNWEWKEHKRICSKHFSPECFINFNHKWRRLKHLAMPSLYLHKEEQTICYNKVSSTSAPSTRAKLARIPLTRAPTTSSPTISAPSASAQLSKEKDLMYQVIELQQDLEKLRIVSKRRLLNINSLRQKINRLKKKNTYLTLRLVDLLQKYES